MTYILAIDQGTTSTRAILFDADMRIAWSIFRIVLPFLRFASVRDAQFETVQFFPDLVLRSDSG